MYKCLDEIKNALVFKEPINWMTWELTRDEIRKSGVDTIYMTDSPGMIKYLMDLYDMGYTNIIPCSLVDKKSSYDICALKISKN